MYSTAKLIELTRRNLLDYLEVNDDNKQGQFWHDFEILTALNTAQDVVVSFLVTNKLWHHLRFLYTSTPFGLGGLLSLLPEPYLHYVSAQVSDSNDPLVTGTLEAAKIYIGGEAEVMSILAHRNLCILNDSYSFNYNRQFSTGIMNYIRRPNRIALLPTPSVNAEFDEWIYKDAIANYAAILLGIKSIQTLRESGKQIQFYKALGTMPPFAVLFLNNVEVIIQQRGSR